MAPQVEAFTLAQQRKALRVLGIDAIGQDLFKAHARADWTQANVALIRSIPAEYFPKVQTHILDAIAQGMRHTTLAKHLKENVIPLADSRAQLIARDQVSKYNGQLARYQQQAVGLEQYEWRAVNDRRTRQTHLDQDGEVYRWDTPTPIGFPGSQIQCRCQSVPVL